MYGVTETYSLFDQEFWDAWQRFDLSSKRFVAQLKREYMEVEENGKVLKRANKVQANRNYDDTLREQKDL
jgi:hypothetical protein